MYAARSMHSTKYVFLQTNFLLNNIIRIISMFNLDERLQNDTVFIGQLPLCKVLLMNDSNYPWLILVPARNDMFEIYHLSSAEQMMLIEESSYVSQYLSDNFEADSMNVAALGNVVPQLHVHHVVRFETDIAWPGPVWGAHPTKAYPQDELKKRVEQLQLMLSEKLVDKKEVDSNEFY
jgi:diadenosine tetraphosphate (Ap4A) HIT family hydrolase